jgi:hypothetical protein
VDATPRLLPHLEAIRHACWMIRYYHRGARVSMHRKQRADAMAALWVALAIATKQISPEECEPLLVEIADGLHPRQPDPSI